MRKLIYDERVGCVAVYEGSEPLNCLNMPPETFLFYRHFQRDGDGWMRDDAACEMAREIVCACNNHTALVQALNDMRKALENGTHAPLLAEAQHEIEEHIPCEGAGPFDEGDYCNDEDCPRCLIAKKICAALAGKRGSHAVL